MKKNRIEFSGVIEKLQSIDTKTGVAMSSLLLKVGTDKFRCVAFKNISEALLHCREGDELNVVGTGSINSWEYNEDRWHNDFQLTIWEVEIDGNITKYEKNTGNDSQAKNSRVDSLPLAPEPDQRSEFDYAGGPF